MKMLHGLVLVQSSPEPEPVPAWPTHQSMGKALNLFFLKPFHGASFGDHCRAPWE